MIATTTTQRELIHWLWLWVLAAIAVSVMQGALWGQDGRPNLLTGQPLELAQDDDGINAGRPIPMPNVDHPDWFRYPNQSPLPHRDAAPLSELLQLQRIGDFQQAFVRWQRVQPLAGSETWKQVGIGVALLRLGRLDKAMGHLEKAVEQDPTNAVAEYFMGRVRQEQGRQVPFWYQSDQELPFHLASKVEPNEALHGETLGPHGKPHPKTFLPHYINDAYDRLARQHFRTAVRLAPQCDLNRMIRVAAEEPPVIQLASQRIHGEAVTVGEFLESLGERDYVRKATAELGVHRARSLTDDAAVLNVVSVGNLVAID